MEFFHVWKEFISVGLIVLKQQQNVHFLQVLPFYDHPQNVIFGHKKSTAVQEMWLCYRITVSIFQTVENGSISLVGSSTFMNWATEVRATCDDEFRWSAWSFDE